MNDSAASQRLRRIEIHHVDPPRAPARRRTRAATATGSLAVEGLHGRSRPAANARRCHRTGRSPDRDPQSSPTLPALVEWSATVATKLARSARPSSPDFSGWNCVANDVAVFGMTAFTVRAVVARCRNHRRIGRHTVQRVHEVHPRRGRQDPQTLDPPRGRATSVAAGSTASEDVGDWSVIHRMRAGDHAESDSLPDLRRSRRTASACRRKYRERVVRNATAACTTGRFEAGAPQRVHARSERSDARQHHSSRRHATSGRGSQVRRASAPQLLAAPSEPIEGCRCRSRAPPSTGSVTDTPFVEGN